MTISAIAHRGDPVRERENTLPAFTAAALAADMIELWPQSAGCDCQSCWPGYCNAP